MGGAVSGLTKAKLLKRLDKAAKAVEREISANAQGGKFASGLANEGWAGGYQQALRVARVHRRGLSELHLLALRINEAPEFIDLNTLARQVAQHAILVSGAGLARVHE